MPIYSIDAIQSTSKTCVAVTQLRRVYCLAQIEKYVGLRTYRTCVYVSLAYEAYSQGYL